MYDQRDLKFSSIGDLVVDATGDLDTSFGIDCDKESILARLRTNNPEWYHHPSIGADIDTMVGEPNTLAVAQATTKKIVSCLTYDGFISPSSLVVTPIPISATQIIYHIAVTNGGQEVSMTIKLNYDTGVEEVL